jgi:predicted site-specific integrase-resolvase
MNGEFVTAKEARRLTGVTTTTLRGWAKTDKVRYCTTPTGRIHYNKQDIYTIASGSGVSQTLRKIAYCRVSSKKQMDDLERQKDFFKNNYPGYHLVTDVGSGLNWKRKGLKTILDEANKGNVSEIVVAHRDRLCRFAFELIEYVLQINNVKLTVINEDSQSKPTIDEELSDDILSIIHVYSCRKMGRRRYPKNKEN